VLDDILQYTTMKRYSEIAIISTNKQNKNTKAPRNFVLIGLTRRSMQLKEVSKLMTVSYVMFSAESRSIFTKIQFGKIFANENYSCMYQF